MAGIYLHIPFCRQACSYCDFHFSTSLANKTAVIEAMLSEAQQRQAYLGQHELVESVYFGGGTPSLLSSDELHRIMETLNRYFQVSRQAEITLEANPDDINPSTLRDWRSAGINRLSLGLQSFSDEELKWMNRTHSAAGSVAAVRAAQDAGFSNISIDLIYGSRFQSEKSWLETLRKAVELQTQHISAYNLTIEKKTLLGVKYARGQEPAVSDEASSAQFMTMVSFLAEAGFEHYEISNFAKSGFVSRHNSAYWLRRSYIGIGPSAHSFDGSSRQWNVSNNNLYVRALKSGGSYFEREELSEKNQFNEYVLTRLRTQWGCDADEIGRLFGGELRKHFETKAADHARFLEMDGEIYRLNLAGRLQADGIASDFFLL